MEKIEFRKTREFGELISDTFKFIRQNLKMLLKSIFIICGFFMLATVLLGVMQQIKMANLLSAPQDVYTGKYFSFKMFDSGYFLTGFIALFNYICISLVTISFVNVYVKKGNQPPTVEEVWISFKYFFFKYVGSCFVLDLLFFAGFALCIFPGLYLYPIVSLISAVVVLEDTTLGIAFDRGFKLIKDHWFTVFGALFIMGIIITACMAIVSIPATIITMINVFVSKNKISMPLMVITSIIQTVCSVFYILPCIVINLSYFSLKEEKDATGLTERINAFGQTKKDNGLSAEEY